MTFIEGLAKEAARHGNKNHGSRHVRVRTYKRRAPARRKYAGEDCPHCGAKLERGDDGCCNQCRKPWPETKQAGSPWKPLQAVKSFFSAGAKPLMTAGKNPGVFTQAASKFVAPQQAGAGYKAFSAIANTAKPIANTVTGNPLSSLAGGAVANIGAGAYTGDPNSKWYDGNRLLATGAGMLGGGYAGRGAQSAAQLLPRAVRAPFANAAAGAFAGGTIDQAAGLAGYDTNNAGMMLGAGIGGAGTLGMQAARRFLPGAADLSGRAAAVASGRFAQGGTGPFGGGNIKDVFQAARGAGRYADASGADRLFGQGVNGKLRRAGQVAGFGGAGALLGGAALDYGQGKINNMIAEGVNKQKPAIEQAATKGVMDSFGLSPEHQKQMQMVTEATKGLDANDPAAVQWLQSQGMGKGPDGQFDPKLARQQLNEIRTNTMISGTGLDKQLAGLLPQDMQSQFTDPKTGQIDINGMKQSLATKFGDANNLLAKGQELMGNSQAGLGLLSSLTGGKGMAGLMSGLSGLSGLADGVLGMMGMDVGSMSGVQKLVTILGGLGLITGLLGGSSGLAGLGGLGLAAGVAPQLLGGRVPGLAGMWGQQAAQQQQTPTTNGVGGGQPGPYRDGYVFAGQ